MKSRGTSIEAGRFDGKFKTIDNMVTGCIHEICVGSINRQQICWHTNPVEDILYHPSRRKITVQAKRCSLHDDHLKREFKTITQKINI